MQGLLQGATGLLIDRRWEPVGTGLEVLDKYTRQPFSVVARPAPADVGRGVAGAARAAASPLPPARRQAVLGGAARLLEARKDEICALYVAETGFTPTD